MQLPVENSFVSFFVPRAEELGTPYTSRCLRESEQLWFPVAVTSSSISHRVTSQLGGTCEEVLGRGAASQYCQIYSGLSDLQIVVCVIRVEGGY